MPTLVQHPVLQDGALWYLHHDVVQCMCTFFKKKRSLLTAKKYYIILKILHYYITEGDAEACCCGQYSARRWCGWGQNVATDLVQFNTVQMFLVTLLESCCTRWCTYEVLNVVEYGPVETGFNFFTCFVAISWPPCQATEWGLVRLIDDFLLHRLLEQERRRDTVPPAVPRLLTSLPVAITDY